MTLTIDIDKTISENCERSVMDDIKVMFAFKHIDQNAFGNDKNHFRKWGSLEEKGHILKIGTLLALIILMFHKMSCLLFLNKLRKYGPFSS